MKSLPILLSLCSLASAPVWAQNSGLSPTPEQREMIERRYGMFIHFGINTFSGQEWTDGTIDPKLYNPTQLDTDQWAKAAKEAGMSYVILITKHHDGFCLWDSPLTTYDVGSSPVKTNVVKAMAASCKKHGLKLGLYYSLWDRNWNNGVMRGTKADLTPDDSEAYFKYLSAQLKELLTENGEICELWFDGGWVCPREDWHTQRIYDLIKKLQPKCQVGINWGIGQFNNPDFHSVQPPQYRTGQPLRYAGDFRLGDPMLPSFPDVKFYSDEATGRLHYMPFETTVTLNKHWFWQPYDKKLLTVNELLPLFEQSTAQDNVLILNSPPNRAGLMEEKNVTRFKELAQALGIKDGKIPTNVAESAVAYADSNFQGGKANEAKHAIDGNPQTRWAAQDKDAKFFLQWPKAQTLNYLRLREFENRTEAFAVDAWIDGAWKELVTGQAIGENLIVDFPKTKTTGLRLRFLKSKDAPSLHFLATGLR